jgi:hypothetical protein
MENRDAIKNQISLLKLAHKMALTEVANSNAQTKLLLDFLQEEHGKVFRDKLQKLITEKNTGEKLDNLLHSVLSDEKCS